MIVLPRAQLRSFRSVLRRSVMAGASRGPAPPVRAVAAGDGVTLRACAASAGLTLCLPGPVDKPDDITFPGELLARLEGTADSAVALERAVRARGVARWQERNLPQTVDFTPVPRDRVPALVDQVPRLATMPVGFLKALDDACRTADRNPVRFALDRIQLQGKTGRLVASDARQLLVQEGLRLPFAQTLLVPALPVFGTRELAGAEPLRLGRTTQRLFIVAGPWCLDLAIDQAGRFPDTDRVIPSGPPRTQLDLGEEDSRFLLETLPGLAPDDGEPVPITLDFGRPPLVRARKEDRVTEILLAGSAVTGAAQRVCLDRKYLLRALGLGFRTLELRGPDKPLLARSEARLWAVALLDSKSALEPSPDAVRLTTTTPAEAIQIPPSTERNPVMNPSTNGAASRSSEQPETLDPLIEVEALKNALQEALNRAGRLTTALRQFRKQQKAVHSAMASLKQLHFTP